MSRRAAAGALLTPTRRAPGCSAATSMASGDAPIDEVLAKLDASIAASGLDVLRPNWRLGNLAKPRMLEVHAALSRLRGLSVAKTSPPRGK